MTLAIDKTNTEIIIQKLENSYKNNFKEEDRNIFINSSYSFFDTEVFFESESIKTQKSIILDYGDVLFKTFKNKVKQFKEEIDGNIILNEYFFKLFTIIDIENIKDFSNKYLDYKEFFEIYTEAFSN